MRILIRYTLWLLGICLTSPAISAEMIHVVKGTTSEAVQSAIDACTAQGGGVAYLPPGRYITGPLWLKDNVELRLEAGATVMISPDKKDWPTGVRALVNSKGAKNIAITGRGTFDGNAQWEYAPVRGQDPEIAEEQENARHAGVEMKRYYRKGDVQKYLFVLQDSEDIRLEGVTIRNAPLWNVRLQNCNRVWIRGIFLYSDLERGVNSDGIDIVSSSNVLIADSIICTADDAICLKTVDLGGRGTGTILPTENVVVNNCILTSSSTAMMIGTETHANIRHVLFSNIVVRDSNKVFGINVQDGATVSDVRFVNVTFETNRRHWNWWGSAEVMKFVLKKRTPQSRLGYIRDITIEGAQGTARGTSLVAGHGERKLENITVANLRVKMLPEDRPDKRATHALIFQGVDGLTLRGVEVDWDREKSEPQWATALVLRDISDLVLQNFRGQAAQLDGPLPAILKDNVTERGGADAKSATTWRSLPLIRDGQVDEAWCHVGWGGFAVDGDSLRTECDPKGLGLLVYKKERFGNCQIRVVFKCKEPKSNSGVIVRLDNGILDKSKQPGASFDRDPAGKISAPSMKEMMASAEREEGPWFAVHRGYEVQIMDDNDKLHRTGAIYSLSASSAISSKTPGEWKTMIITLSGNRIFADLDDQRVASFDPESPDGPQKRQWFEPKREPKRPESGYIGLQNHDPGDIVWFKEVSVRPLPDASTR